VWELSKRLRRFARSGRARRQDCVSIVGLCHAGRALAIAFSRAGCRVEAVDPDPERASALDEERGSTTHGLGKRRGRIATHRDLEKAINKANAILLVLPQNPEQIDRACMAIAHVLHRATNYRLVAIVGDKPSPWATTIIDTIEQISRRKSGPDFGFCSWHVRTHAGPDSLTNPAAHIVIGESDTRAGSSLEKLLVRTVARGASVERIALTRGTEPR
jgi:hypothetical protein